MNSGIGGGDPRPTDWSDPTQAADYPPTADPAYAEPYPGTYPGPYPSPPHYDTGYGTGYNTGYGTGYGTGYSNGYGQTGQLPAHWQPGNGYPGAPPPTPPPGKPGRWLWIGAGAAVAVIAGLVLALVVMSSSTRDSTVVAPPPERGSPETMPIPLPIPTELPTEVPTRVPAPTATREPLPSSPVTPETTAPGVTETVVYTVTGEGRAINITYVDSGGVMQTEFNVALPWSKEVSLAAPAKKSASVAILNVGRDVTCSVSVDGAQVRQRTGRGLTICSGAV